MNRHPRYEEIKAMALKHIPTHEIAKQLSLQSGVVAEIIYRMRKSGKLPSFENKNAFAYIRYQLQQRTYSQSLGSVKKLLSLLPFEVGQWLLRITPNDATIADTIAAIITDAYHEEKERTNEQDVKGTVDQSCSASILRGSTQQKDCRHITT